MKYLADTLVELIQQAVHQLIYCVFLDSDSDEAIDDVYTELYSK